MQFHAIAPNLVEASVAGRIQSFQELKARQIANAGELAERYAAATAAERQRNWVRAPSTVAEIETIYDGFVAKERDHYSTVQILEDESRKTKSFFLVYGGNTDSRTGGFASKDDAERWFTTGGR